MVVPKSKLAAFVSDCIQAVQAGRADALAGDAKIQTEETQISFSVQVVDDTAAPILVQDADQVQPETRQVTTKRPSQTVQTTVKPDTVQVQESRQTQEGADEATESRGTSTTTDVTYTD